MISTLSIIVPARNEEAVLPATLPYIMDAARNAGTSSCEVIIVVPTDSPFVARPPIRNEGLHWVTTEVPGKYEAMRRGVAHATGSHLVFLDADVTPDQKALSLLWNALQYDGVDAVAGRIVLDKSTPTEHRSLAHRVLEFWTKVNFTAWHRLRQTRPDLRWALPGAMYGLERRFFPTDGLLVPTLDDASIGIHMVESGARIAYEPEATVKVLAASSLGQWYRQKLRIRRGWRLLKEVRPHQVSAIQAHLSYETDCLCDGSLRARLLQWADRLMAKLAERSRLPQSIREGSWNSDRRGHPITAAYKETLGREDTNTQ